MNGVEMTCKSCGETYVAANAHDITSHVCGVYLNKKPYKSPVLRELTAVETLTKLLEVLTPEDRLAVFSRFCVKCGFKQSAAHDCRR